MWKDLGEGCQLLLWLSQDVCIRMGHEGGNRRGRLGLHWRYWFDGRVRRTQHHRPSQISEYHEAFTSNRCSSALSILSLCLYLFNRWPQITLPAAHWLQLFVLFDHFGFTLVILRRLFQPATVSTRSIYPVLQVFFPFHDTASYDLTGFRVSFSCFVF
ncbi:hypothetical protein BDM02DRAFT_1995871 [Thelephora ganbajun]|uniref:Uncharacterized protein n=1 Tax=Thelephora ganbajun TaxID=370292 RepID=A0ACB6ZHA8_THEGA|nr:hypothetical protein BDM02DRAFT_1995871 [Thelephora ganbajun]